MSYTPSTNKDYLRRVQFAYSPLDDLSQFLNVGFVSRYTSNLTNDREVIRELGFEDIGFDLKLGEVVTADLAWRAIDPTMIQWFMSLADGTAGSPSNPVAVLEDCNINGVEKFFLTDGLKPTRLSLTYARMLEVTGSMIGISQTDAMTEAELETLLGIVDPAEVLYAENIITPPWSNLSGETTTPLEIDTGSGMDAYPNKSFTMDVGRAVANNQPSGNTAPTHLDITNREITGSWTTILKDDPFYDAVKDATPMDMQLTLKAGATPCVLSLVDMVFNAFPRVSDSGSTNHREITFSYQAKSASISDYVAV